MITAKKLSKIEISSYAADQVAEMFGKSISTVYNYVNRGKKVSNDIYVRLDRGFVHGKSTRFHKASLIKFLEQIEA